MIQVKLVDILENFSDLIEQIDLCKELNINSSEIQEIEPKHSKGIAQSIINNKGEILSKSYGSVWNERRNTFLKLKNHPEVKQSFSFLSGKRKELYSITYPLIKLLELIRDELASEHGIPNKIDE